MLRGGIQPVSRRAHVWALWLLLLAGFVVMSALAAAHYRFPGDLWLTEHIQDIDGDAVAHALDWAEDLADTPLIAVVYACALATLLVARLRWEALLLAATLVASPINSAAKALVDRPRPPADLVLVRDFPSNSSFPSGHADTAIVFYGLLFYFVTMFVPQPALRLAGQAACLLVIGLTGLERVYVGAHWPSDVLGGFYLGGLMLWLLIAAHRLRPPGAAAVTDGEGAR